MRKLIGALMLASLFVALGVPASIMLGAWWAGPAILLGCAALIAFVVAACVLLTS